MTDEQLKKTQLLTRYRAQDGHENPQGYEYQLRQLFKDVSLKDQSVLEIGSGRGLLSLYCAAAGANRVVSMEPEMEGSTGGVTEVQQERIQELGVGNQMELLRENFHDANFEGQSFDIILMIAVLNHLYETPIDATTDQGVFDRYVEIASRLRSLLNKDGVVIATDACRYCLWTQAHRFGLPRSLCLTQKTIEWRIHQQPAVWKKIFMTAGFQSCEISYPVPHRLRHFHSIVDSPVANWMLNGGFILHAKK